MVFETDVPPLIDSEVDRADDVGHDEVLQSLRAFHVEYLRREQGLVLLAVQWARLNPGLKRTWPDGTPNTCSDGVDPEDLLWEELAERGCLHMDDIAIPTFAEAAGITEFQARRLVRESLMMVYLLPRVWQRVSQGQIDVWRARKLAEECWDLTPEAVDYVDRLMSLSTARHTQGGRDGVITEARSRFMAEQVAHEQQLAQEQREVEISTEEWGNTGLASVWATVDLPDALDLERAISSGADTLKKLGSDAPIDVRRSWALGDLARAAQNGTAGLFDSRRPERQLAADSPVFLPDCACALGLHPPGRGAPPTEVMMYLHLTPESLTPFPPASPSADGCGGEEAAAGDGVESTRIHARENTPENESNGEVEGKAVSTSPPAVVRVEGNGIPSGMVLSPEVIKSWLSRPSGQGSPKINFRPVVDLHEHQQVEAYEVPERLKEQVALTVGGCVFPWCHRPARRTDCDHIIPWKENGEGGPTCTCNLAKLCRSHHRAKTHADNHIGNEYTWWNYESLGEGKYLWKGPKGTVLLRTNTGVYDVSTEHTSAGPKPPGHYLPERTLADVTTSNEELQSRVQAAAVTVHKISVTIPDHDPGDDHHDDEGVMEFPVPKPKPKSVSWHQRAFNTAGADDDPPNVVPGSLPDRVLNPRVNPPSLLIDALKEYRTEKALFSTPEQRRFINFNRQFYKETGYPFPRPKGTRYGGLVFYEPEEHFPWSIDIHDFKKHNK